MRDDRHCDHRPDGPEEKQFGVEAQAPEEGRQVEVGGTAPPPPAQAGEQARHQEERGQVGDEDALPTPEDKGGADGQQKSRDVGRRRAAQHPGHPPGQQQRQPAGQEGEPPQRDDVHPTQRQERHRQIDVQRADVVLNHQGQMPGAQNDRRVPERRHRLTGQQLHGVQARFPRFVAVQPGQG